MEKFSIFYQNKAQRIIILLYYNYYIILYNYYIIKFILILFYLT